MTDPAATGPIPLRVLVVDPDDRIRESITRLLPIGGRCAVVGSAGDTDEAVALASTLIPEVAVIDSRFADDESSAGFIGRLRSIVPGIRVLVLNWTETTEPDPSLHGADAYMWSARLALDRGDKVAARTIYTEAIARDSVNPRLRSGYAALLADAGDNAAAANALAQGPQDDLSYGARAAYAARADDKALLAALYREMEADKSAREGKRIYLLGQVAELIDKREAALAWYREVPEDDEHGFDAQMRIALVLDQLDRTAEALQQLHRLTGVAAGDTEQQRNVWLLEADLLAKRQRFVDALAVYDRALLNLPDDARLLYARALLAVDHGDVAGGERDLRRVLELKPDDAEALNALGYTLADRSQGNDARQHEALDLIQRALKLKPDEPAIIDSMGWVRYRLGDLDASLENLRNAYAKQPDPDIAAHLGEVLWARGQRDEARRVWDEGRKKDARNKALIETIRRLTQ